MANALLLLLPFLFSILFITGKVQSAVASTSFIWIACRGTTYPTLCVQSLSAHTGSSRRSPRELAQIALSLSLKKAESTKTFVKRLTKFKGLEAREYGAIRDCLQEMGDSVNSLTKSVQELKNMGRAKGEDFLWHISNVQTWVSAALTDETSCMDGFAGNAMNGRIKTSLRIWIAHVAQATSNALALVNQYAEAH